MRILLVEDQVSLREAISFFLDEKEGHSVVAVSNGATAIELLGNNDGFFNIVISDFDLPGANGHQVFEAAKGLPFILMSGDIEHNDGKVFLKKPFRFEALEKAIKEVMAK